MEPSQLPLPALEKVLKQEFSDDNLTITRSSVRECPEVGCNFVSDAAILDLTLETKGEETNLTFFIKKTPEHNGFLEMFTQLEMYQREVVFYNEVLPRLNEVCEDADAPNLLMEFLPRCYFASEELIVLEDLGRQGYRPLPKGSDKDVDILHSELLFSALAVLHATSFAFREKSRIPLIQSFPFLRDRVFHPDAFIHWKLFYEDPLKNLLSVLDEDSPSEHELLHKLQYFCNHGMEIGSLALSPQHPVNVICHRDTWIHNLMFLNDNSTNPPTPKKIKLVDYQMASVAHPTLDLLKYLYGSTTPVFRLNHQDSLLRLYHTRFQSALRTLNSPAHAVSREDLQSGVEDRRLFGFLTAISTLCFRHLEKIPSQRETFQEFTTTLREEMAQVARRKDSREAIRKSLFALCDEAKGPLEAWLKIMAY